MIKQSTIKILCTTLILTFTMQSTFAVQNYVTTTTTNEQYSASSPTGRFENYSSNGIAIPIGTNIATPITPLYDYNYAHPAYYQPEYSQSGYSQPATVASATPSMNYYGAPVYTAAVNYEKPDSNQNYSVQDIKNPQNYNRTVTTTEQCVDTREKADKVIDRGMKIVGTLAVVGAVAGLVINACTR